MPIVQFKNRPARLDAGLPELGRLYKGAPRQSENQKQVPPDLDYFRFEANDLPTASAAVIEAAWEKLHGDTPKIIRNVQFAIDRMDLAFDAWNESWGRSKAGAPLLNKRCDGETIVFEREGDKVYREPVACQHKCDCKPTGRLRMFIPALCAELGVLGIVTLITHAGTDIDNIANTLSLVWNQTGRLRNVAFVLYREMVQLMTPAGLPVQKSIVRLELDTVSAQALALAAGNGQPVLENVPANVRPALPSPVPSDVPHDVPPGVDESAAPEDPFEHWSDVPNAPLPAIDKADLANGRKLLGRAVTASTRATKTGKAIDLTLASGATITLYTREPLRKLSALWADTVAKWSTEGTHPFLDLAGEVDAYANGKGYEFEIPSEFAALHAQPEV